MFKYCKEKEHAVSKFAKCSFVDIKWLNETNKIQWYKAKVIRSPIDYEYDSSAFCIRYVKDSVNACVHVLDNKYVSCKNEDDEFMQFEWRESRDSRQLKKNADKSEDDESEDDESEDDESEDDESEDDESEDDESKDDFIVDSDSLDSEDYSKEWELWREKATKKSSTVDEYMNRSIVNGLYCRKCKKEHHKDNFSVVMQKETNRKRYCLNYTSSSDFNRPAIIRSEPIMKRRLVLAEE